MQLSMEFTVHRPRQAEQIAERVVPGIAIDMVNHRPLGNASLMEPLPEKLMKRPPRVALGIEVQIAGVISNV